MKDLLDYETRKTQRVYLRVPVTWSLTANDVRDAFELGIMGDDVSGVPRKNFELMVTPGMKYRMQKAAEGHGMNLSEYLRRCVAWLKKKD